MTRRQIVLFAIVAVLVVAFVALWVVPTVRGPSVDCGDLDEAACDRVVAGIIAGHRQAWEDGIEGQLPPYLPVLSVTIFPGSTEGCSSYQISWLFGGWVVEVLC